MSVGEVRGMEVRIENGEGGGMVKVGLMGIVECYDVGSKKGKRRIGRSNERVSCW